MSAIQHVSGGFTPLSRLLISNGHLIFSILFTTSFQCPLKVEIHVQKEEIIMLGAFFELQSAYRESRAENASIFSFSHNRLVFTYLKAKGVCAHTHIHTHIYSILSASNRVKIISA